MRTLVSVIVEWENAKLSELERANRMLEQLGAQMALAARERDLSAELLVLYDSDAVDPAVPSAAVAANIDRALWPGTILFVPTPGQRYYEQKNKGAQLAKGDTLIFLDSDVIPDEGWLQGLLSAMSDPAMSIVGGETYHATETFYDKLFAAFWVFPPRPSSCGVYPHKTFYANNLAVSRPFFLANPFPDAPAYRGQCAQLAKSLREQGFSIYRQGRSSVSHPPPQGARTFVVRALCRGHDAVYWKGRYRFAALLHTNPVASFVRWLRELWQVLVRVVTRARAVGLGPVGALTAIGLGFVYFSLKFAGEVMTFFSPGIIRRNFSV
ncbi:MAG: glycosyltransferase [Hyphomicrobiaceae bacterium]|nr:glycosyltransferase [Hyphomicrobiaceae bacterium]